MNNGAEVTSLVSSAAKVVMGLLAAGVAALMAYLWHAPTDMAVMQERVGAVKEIPIIQNRLGVIEYRVGELHEGQATFQKELTDLNNTQLNISEKIDDVLKNQRTAGGAR